MTDYDELLEQFGPEVAGAVAALTKDARLPQAEREAAYDRQLAAAAWPAAPLRTRRRWPLPARPRASASCSSAR